MAAPLLALPFLGKLGGALGALKAGGAAKAGMGAYKALAGAGVPKSAARFAGDKIMKIGRGLTSKEGFVKNLFPGGLPPKKDELAMMVAPDLLFGGMAALSTEGDIVDKALAGAGSAAGGIVGGLGLRGALGPKKGLGILGTEMIGGILGDQVGYGAANALIAAKHGGMTPAEKRMLSDQQVYENQLKSQLYKDLLAENGMG